MPPAVPRVLRLTFALGVLLATTATGTLAQSTDRTQAPNPANEGIAKSLTDQIGAGRGDLLTPNSSAYILARDPFRAIRRGRQLFQRKFTRAQGLGPNTGDGRGDIAETLTIGAGIGDSCAACHGRPRGAAGFGGDVVTRPDSRDAPHLFGLGLQEMLADEMTTELRALRTAALARAAEGRRPVTVRLVAKGIPFGQLTALPEGTVDTTGVKGVDGDLRVRPFFAHGSTISIREFVVGALNAEMGLRTVDPEVTAAARGARIVTPAGMVLDGSIDRLEVFDEPIDQIDDPSLGVRPEIAVSVVDFLEFYLLNYFKPGTGEQTQSVRHGRRVFEQVGCVSCHVPDMTIQRDRRVADVETVFDPRRGVFNRLFATAIPLFAAIDDGTGLPPLKPPRLQPFVVRDIFTDFKRHDLGPEFHERNYDGTVQREFMTEPLWGVGTSAPYGHDGRSINLREVILRHGGEATAQRKSFARLPHALQDRLLDFLGSLILFPPDDTASNLNPGNPAAAGFPQNGHGSIRLTVLFNDTTDVE